jgi:hypothetical protein
MKTRCILLCFALAPLPLRADPPANETPFAAARTEAGPAPDLAALEQFLNLSDAQLDEMQAALARVRAMLPAERARLRDEILAYRRLPAGERAAIRQGWGHVPAEVREGWREMMQSLDPARRAEIQARLAQLPPAERTACRRELVERYLKDKRARP